VLRFGIKRIARALWRLSTIGIECSENIIRYEMYRNIQEKVCDLDLRGNVLSVSHSEHLCQLIGVKAEQIFDASYPAYDLGKLALPDNSFDAVVSDQVLEHIDCEPGRAIRETYRILKPGGIAIHTTCFLTPFHGSPEYDTAGDGDYWRYTHHGLRRLHADYSRVISADGWGNPFVPIVTGLGLGHSLVPRARWHPLNKLARFNWPSYHHVVWIVAQK
jgi:SAM-dependent methyltransferase